MPDRPANLHHLLTRRAQLANLRFGAQGKPILLDQMARLLPQAFPRNEPVARTLAPQKDVLGHRQMRGQQTLLMHHRDAGFGRIARAAKSDRLPPPQETALVRRLHAGDDLHQRRFAGAVLTHQQMHFAGVDR